MLGKAAHKIATSNLRSGESKKAVTVATAVVNDETPPKKEDTKEGYDVKEERRIEINKYSRKLFARLIFERFLFCCVNNIVKQSTIKSVLGLSNQIMVF